MFRNCILVILPLLACIQVQSYLIEPQDEILNNYKATRALLTPEQEEFLMELLAADDALIEAQTSRGIVDDILQALAGAGNGGNIRVNILGGGQQQQPNAPAPILNPSFTLVSNPTSQNPGQQQKALLNSTNASTSNSSSSASSPPILSMLFGNNGTQYQMNTGSGNTTTIGGSNNHLFSTISSVIMNSNRRNVTGIVDESLRIATPAPIREFVTGILQVVYCNGIRRLLGRC